MIFRDDALAGKHILVTGATSGIGRNAATMMAACGAQIVLVGRDTDRLGQALAGLQGDGHKTEAADISSLDAAHDLLVRLARESGAFDGVFHAAGMAGVRMAKMLNAVHLETVMGAAVNGALGIAKACAKQSVLRDGGSILFMASVAGHRGTAGMVGYSTAKAAIGGLTRSLAAELAPRGTRVNEIIAGAIETEMHAAITGNLDQASQDAYRDLHMLGFGQPEDVSAAAVFLLSDAARWITGASIAVDGGYMAQ